ncbi:hypothetical protein HDV05_008783, partial [Chytridiales sp. JEL 0842]
MDIHAFIELDKKRGFPFGGKHWARLTLVRGLDGENDHIVLSLHHVIFDGWSLPMFRNDFMDSFCNGPRAGSLVYRPQFEEVLESVASQDLDAIKEFWIGYLADFDDCPDLKMIGPSEVGGADEDAEIKTPSQLSLSMVQTAAQASKVTIATIYKAALVILLRDLMQVRDVVFAELLTGRHVEVADVELVCGSLINVVPCRVQLKDDISISGLIKLLHEDYVAKLPYTNFSLADVQKLVGGKNDQLANTLFLLQMLPSEKRNPEAYAGKLSQYIIKQPLDTRGYLPFEVIPIIEDDKVYITAKFNRNNMCREQAVKGTVMYDEILTKVVDMVLEAPNSRIVDVFPPAWDSDNYVKTIAETSFLTTLPLSLQVGIESRRKKSIAHFVNRLQSTTFYKTSPSLALFREMLLDYEGPLSDDELVKVFVENVPVSSYATYEPYVSRFLAKPCTESSVLDLLTPGLPAFISHSSSTSGGKPKLFPTDADFTFSRNGDVWTKSASRYLKHEGGKYFSMHSLVVRDTVFVTRGLGSNEQETLKIPVCLGSVAYQRAAIGHLDVGCDEDLRHSIDPETGYPLAIKLIRNYESFLFMSACFALADEDLEHVVAVFSTLLLDWIKLIIKNWDSLIECVEFGVLPRCEGVDDNMYQILQSHFHANSSRSKFLRSLSKGKGWLKVVWPKLEIFEASSGGVFADAVTEIMWNAGDMITFKQGVYASTETNVIGLSMNDPSDVNLFQIVDLYDNVFEYL